MRFFFFLRKQIRSENSGPYITAVQCDWMSMLPHSPANFRKLTTATKSKASIRCDSRRTSNVCVCVEAREMRRKQSRTHRRMGSLRSAHSADRRCRMRRRFAVFARASFARNIRHPYMHVSKAPLVQSQMLRSWVQHVCSIILGFCALISFSWTVQTTTKKSEKKTRAVCDTERSRRNTRNTKQQRQSEKRQIYRPEIRQ